MANKEGGDWGNSRDTGTRADSPLIGIILLFALVMMGAMLVFVAGSAMFDAIQSEADREQAQQFMLETDHRLSTVAETKTEQVLPDGVGPSDVNGNGGQIEVAWYANGPSSDPWSDASCSVNDSLGTLEYEQAGGTIAHQGGGIWETTNGETSIVSEPNIGYDNDTLQLQILQLDNGDFGGSEAVARADHSNATDLTQRINNASTRCSDRGNVAIRIESEYHDGWYQFLEDSLGENEYEGVNVTQTGSTVEVRIEEVREPVDRPTFIVTEDRGLSGPGKTDLKYDQRVEYMDLFTVEAMIENTGSKAHTENVTVSIWDENFNTKLHSSPKYEITIAGNDTETISKNNIIFEPGKYKSELEPGESYRYVIETESGDKTDDPSGSFYVGESGSSFNVTDIETTPTGDGNVTIDASVRNNGVENGTQNVMLDFASLGVSDMEQLTLEYGATGSVSWTINESSLPSRSNAFTVETSDTDLSGTIVGTGGSGKEAFIVVEDKGVGNGQIVSNDGPFTVEGTVQNTYAAEQTRDVTLTIPDANVGLSERQTLESGERETVTFKINPAVGGDFEPGSVYEYNIEADGNGLRKNGSFYFGEPGTYFELSDQNVTVRENVTITADLTNIGTANGSQEVSLELTYLDDMPARLEDENLYGEIDTTQVTRSFGESGTLDVELNGSKLLDGEYEATIHTDDDTISRTFNVSAGLDPGRVSLGGVEDANVTVDVLGSQVSGMGLTRDHQLSPMTLDVITNGQTQHSFSNPSGGDNVNTGPTWQNKDAESYHYEFTVDEKTDLTLQNTRYSTSTLEFSWSEGFTRVPTCAGRRTDPETLSAYSGPSDPDLAWCTDVPEEVAFGPIDASQGQNLQNVRVRSAENNTIPALPAGAQQQMSATEVLQERGLVNASGDKLDLDRGEFVFLFDNTAECGRGCNENNIDALWDEAIDAYESDSDSTHDPDFNDLIVYVEVERANVDPGALNIAIDPGSGGPTTVDPGDGNTAGDAGAVNPTLETDTDVGSGPGDLEPGKTGTDDNSSVSGNTGVDVDTDHIVIG